MKQAVVTIVVVTLLCITAGCDSGGKGSSNKGVAATFKPDTGPPGVQGGAPIKK